MKKILIVLAFVFSFVISKAQSGSIECVSCYKEQGKNCPTCTSALDANYFNGILLKDSKGKIIERLHKPFKTLMAKGTNVYIVDLNDKKVTISLPAYGYSNAIGLINAICACDAPSGGGVLGTTATILTTAPVTVGTTTLSTGTTTQLVLTTLAAALLPDDMGTVKSIAPITIGSTTYATGTSAQTLITALKNGLNTNTVLLSAPVTIGTITYPINTTTQIVLAALNANFNTTSVVTTAALTIAGTVYPIGTPVQTILNALNASAVLSFYVDDAAAAAAGVPLLGDYYVDSGNIWGDTRGTRRTRVN